VKEGKGREWRRRVGKAVEEKGREGRQGKDPVVSLNFLRS